MEDLAARRAADALLAAHKANVQFTALDAPDKPATIPDANPRAVGFPLKIHSTRTQLSPAAAAAA